MMFSIRVCSLFGIRQVRGFEARYMVSLIGPDIDVLSLRPSGILGANHFVLRFADTTNPNDPDAPTQEQMRELIRIAQRLADTDPDAHILIHCAAGVSRSPAAAFIFFAVQLGEGNEEDALDRTDRATESEWCWPNELMIRYADEILQRHGRMLAALEDLH